VLGEQAQLHELEAGAEEQGSIGEEGSRPQDFAHGPDGGEGQGEADPMKSPSAKEGRTGSRAAKASSLASGSSWRR